MVQIYYNFCQYRVKRTHVLYIKQDNEENVSEVKLFCHFLPVGRLIRGDISAVFRPRYKK